MAVGLPDGQMGNSEVGPPQYRRRPDRLPGSDPYHQVDQGRRFFCQSGAAGVHRKDQGRWRQAAPGGPALGRRRALPQQPPVRPAGTGQTGGLKEVFVHCLLDGRDTPPQSGVDYLAQLETEISRIGVGRIATVMGRYYAMDRDNRWERVEKAYNAMVCGEGEQRASAREAIEASYKRRSSRRICRPVRDRRQRRRRSARSGTATASSSSTSAPIGPAKSPAPSLLTALTASSAAAVRNWPITSA